MLKEILKNSKTIAVVGHSDKPERTSYKVAQYLRRAGYKVYPVNPAVKTIDGQPCFASVKDIPDNIDIVNVFRQSEHLEGVVDDAIAAKAKVVWAQLGVTSEAAAKKASDANIPIIMDRCIKIEHRALFAPAE